MKKKGTLSFLLMLISVIGLFMVQYHSVADAQPEEKIFSNVTLEDEFADDRVVIVLNKEASMNFKTYTPEDFPDGLFSRVDDSTALTMELVRKQIEAEKTGDWSELVLHVENAMLVDVENFRRILDLILNEPSRENVLMAIELLKNREDILYVGPVGFFSLAAVPSPKPTYYDIFQKIPFDRISLEQAWNITTGSSTVKVGVVDSGIDATHPALSNRINTNLSRDFTDPYYPNGIAGGLTDQVSGHGTAVAGVIGANGTGVIGVNWDVTLVSLKVLPDYGSSYWSYVRNAVDYAISSAIPILNMSLGGFNTDPALKHFIDIYPGLAVCAAGNAGVDIGTYEYFPAAYSKSVYNMKNVISVGATKYDSDSRADASDWPPPAPGDCPTGATCLGGSNYGVTAVDLFAPGIVFTTVPSSYSAKVGTSFASPFVTGVAALMKSQASYLDAKSIKKIINKTVDTGSNLTPANSLAAYCKIGGRLNAYEALDFTANSWIPCYFTCVSYEQTCTTYQPLICQNACEQQAIAAGCVPLQACLSMIQACYSSCMAASPCYSLFDNCVANCSN